MKCSLQPVSDGFTLGFAGHRVLGDPDGAKAALLRELRWLTGRLDGEVICVSSAAAGSDLLFLESCAELGLKTFVILPFELSRFREDFIDGNEWERARALIECSWKHTVIPGNAIAPAAYQLVSRELLRLADHMVFIWDGEPPKGPGGTGETVHEAWALNSPSTDIDSGTLQSQRPDAVHLES